MRARPDQDLSEAGPGVGRIDVVGVGNAMVDVISNVDDDALEGLGLVKGSMTLVDEVRADRLTRAILSESAQSGGSAANTMVGVTDLGGTAALIGKVADDDVGRVFCQDLRAAGVIFDSRPGPAGGPASGRCVVLVTPDGERTMSTYLGAGNALGPADVDGTLVARAKVAYLEGYLWDLPDAKNALRQVASHARAAGALVALSLSDSFCVDRHRDSFQDFIASDVDLVFGNEAEMCLLLALESVDQVVAATRDLAVIAAITMGERGSVVVSEEAPVEVAAIPVARVIDTTGAGDLYAAGFLYGFTHDLDLEGCGRLGSLAAAEVIGHLGARSKTSVRTMAEAISLLDPA